MTDYYDVASLQMPEYRDGFWKSYAGEHILQLMKGHPEQKRFAAKYIDRLMYLGTCKPDHEFPECKLPNRQYVEKANKLQKVYGPIKVRDYRNELCPCPGE